MVSFYNQADFRAAINSLEEPNQKKVHFYSKAISLCREVLQGYRSKISETGFPDVQSEIAFFKVQKQVPFSHLVFYHALQDMELETLRLGEDRKTAFLQERLEKTDQFFLVNLEFVKYLELEQTHLDEVYFTRRYASSLPNRNYLSLVQDMEFSTSHDFLLAQVLANQMLSEHLQNALKVFFPISLNNKGGIPPLQWTDSKAALTELIFALHCGGALNSGNATIKELVVVFEQMFSIDLGDYHHTFLRLRERNNPVKFLDHLRERLSQRISDLDI